MRVSLIKQERIRSINIPDVPSGNFWVTDYDESGRDVNLISIKAENGKWHLFSNQEVACTVNGSYVPSFELKDYNFYTIRNLSTQENLLIYCVPSCDENIKSYYVPFNEGSSITFGSYMANVTCDLLEPKHAKITFENGRFSIYDLTTSKGVYVNNLRIVEKKTLEYGDIVFLNGLKFIFSRDLSGAKIDICYYNHSVNVSGLTIASAQGGEASYSELEEDVEMKWYEEDDYFYKTPRFISEIKEREIKIDAPPTKEPEPDTPIILTIGPMLTMSMSSMVMAFVSISNIRSGNSSFLSVLPSLAIAIAMVTGTLLWPSISRKYDKKRRKRKEEERITKYSNYIDGRRKVILQELEDQQTILKRTYPNLYECSNIILKRANELWQKRIEDEDFLKVSLGFGNYPMKIKISYPEEHFTMVEDELKSRADSLSREPKILKDVPVPYSFIENNITAIIGTYPNTVDYFKKLLLQIVTFHSYTDLKLIIFSDSSKASNWEFLKNTPYCFSDDKKIRLFASNKDEYNDLANYLETIYNARKENKNDVNPHKFDKIYLIITDSFKMIRNVNLVNSLLKEKNNYGFSFVILNKNIASLPEQCKTFIKVDYVNGELSKNVLNSEKQAFLIDLITGINYNECYKMLSNIPIETIDNTEGGIPDKVGFLEMYDVGKVEQLNSVNRWQNSNPIVSLRTPVGYGVNNELQSIDLHEKYHGPHGLIAGMTGSGKSEFIITYILSMAVNYNPNEVQFILIDYKGGGLAGAFENSSSGKKLPHLVGTITNLDAGEIKRSLSSIESELKRRQRLFNAARDKTGEGTIDIYKYQRLYREGIVSEPVSHLFIISDEFAELKNQQPEFMDQLISTARIGRSLGIHLILATQKPSGVVDPQIWSNTRFRVCLRVQDKADSNEVIKCPDAAFLTHTGRFYFQVGYNEVFTLGQAAWAGAKYVPAEKTKKPIDTSIEFINNVGQVIKKVETKDKPVVNDNRKLGEELTNIVSYLADVANSLKIKSRPLWLEKIPSFIKVVNLINKYGFKPKKNVIDIPVGEFDIPQQQQQSLLTVPFTQKGNTLLYGAPGSGKENFIMTLIYSAMNVYTPWEINFYIMDFGAEILKVYKNSSYVGDVVEIDDSEKVNNLYKLLGNIIEKRKEKFSAYGGNYYSYCQKTNDKVPAVVVVINNYEAYYDTYENHDDELNTITREGVKYGVYFIITCNTPNAMRFKLKQNFSQIYCLQQNNDDDYSTILGNVNKNYPSKLFGRGIIKLDTVYEFQTASVDAQETINETIEEMIDNTNKKYDYHALPIPTLPAVVTYDSIKESFDGKNLVVGIEKDSLEVIKYDLKKNLITAIMTNDTSIMGDFVNAFINQVKHLKQVQLMVISAENMGVKETTKEGVLFEENDFNGIFERLLKYQNDCYDLYQSNGYDLSVLANQTPIILLINGIVSFKNKLSDENKNKFSEFFTKSKELGIINYVMIDNVDNFKKVEFEAWFKTGYNPNDGIWIGNGINDQFIMKPVIRTSALKDVIGDDFGFVLQRGRPYLVKYVRSFNFEKDVDIIEE